jgi:heat-inducible transcriptional repressor
MVLGGSSNLFSHKEYGRDALELLDFLNKKEPLTAVFNENKDPLNVKIGRENLYRQLENASVIIARYSVGGDNSGTIGLIGPTRMDYENIIPSIKYLTDLVGSLITQAIEE